MSISNISVNNFRILSDVNINFSNINIFYGLNGSGKTSILECLFFLSRGRSFKQSISRKLISFGRKDFVIFSTVSNGTKIGISKNHTGNLLIKFDNKYINSSFILSQTITLQILSPDSYLLLESGPSIRRKFIDWYVFHVKHNLHESWKRYNTILKQRNSALKAKLTENEIKAWDNEFVNLTVLISNKREEFVDYLNNKLIKYKSDYFDDMELFIDFNPGWNQVSSYSSILDDSYLKDYQYGYTQYGLNKSDFKLKIKIDKKIYLVKDILSNGLKKYISMLLTLIQIELYIEDNTNIDISTPVLLVDDITSELDKKYSQLLLKFLFKLDIQLFFTLLDNIDNNLLISSLSLIYEDNVNLTSNKIKLFHVKHGKINEEKDFTDVQIEK
jgi:DNA replication and repair protein RecF